MKECYQEKDLSSIEDLEKKNLFRNGMSKKKNKSSGWVLMG